MLKPRRRKVAKQKLKGKTIYEVNTDSGSFTIDAIKVYGGVLYVSTHHGFKQINTVFVKDENIVKHEPKIDYEKAYKFLTDTED